MLSVERKLRISEGNEVFFSCRAEAISTKLNLAKQESASKEEKKIRVICVICGRKYFP